MGWIYARDADIPDADIPDADHRALLARFKAAGYDPSKFRKFVQTPAEIGRPGYWSDGVTAPRR